MYPIYLAGSLHEATMLLDRLIESGLKGTVRNQQLQGALGELPLSVQPEVCVFRAEDVAPARRIAASYEAALLTEVEGVLRCPKCGEESPANFELCWSCRSDLSVRE